VDPRKKAINDMRHVIKEDIESNGVEIDYFTTIGQYLHSHIKVSNLKTIINVLEIFNRPEVPIHDKVSYNKLIGHAIKILSSEGLEVNSMPKELVVESLTEYEEGIFGMPFNETPDIYEMYIVLSSVKNLIDGVELSDQLITSGINFTPIPDELLISLLPNEIMVDSINGIQSIQSRFMQLPIECLGLYIRFTFKKENVE